MTKKFVGLAAILLCHATVTSPENATAASASQNKTQMPAAHPMQVTPPALKTNITQPVHDRKEFLLNMKTTSQGAVKGKSTRETSTPVNDAPVITTKIHPSSLTNKVNPSPLDQVGAPSLNGSSKDAAQMPVLKAFPPYSFDKFGVAGNASAASANQPGEAGSAVNVIFNSLSGRKLYAPPSWSHDDESPKETTTFEYGGLSVSPIGSTSVLRVGAARVENVNVSQTITIGGARTEDVGNSSTIKIGAARTGKVSDSNTITVGGGITESVSGSNRITTGATSTDNVSGPNTKTIGGARNENLGSSTGGAGQAKDLNDSSSLKLQMEMDDRSKLLQTLSDTQKSQVDTGNSIIKNIK
jgi:hypothetical protein